MSGYSHVMDLPEISVTEAEREAFDAILAAPETNQALKHDSHEMLTFAPLEADPTGRKPHEAGAKLDAGKEPVMRGLLDYFPRACLAVAEVSAFGAKKYQWKGWENVPDGVARYSDAEMRHACKEAIDGPLDPDSGLLHKAHRAWNALAALELAMREAVKQRGQA